jgi:hypothetical protein
MLVFNDKIIQNLATSLAHNWLQRNESDRRDPTAEQFASTLIPGVAAFLCVLTGALPDREEWLRPIVARYFGEPATAAALGRLFAGQDDARQESADAFLRAGMDAAALDRAAFDEALAVLVAAVAESARRQGLPLWPIAQPQTDSPGADWRHESIVQFIDALAAGGLGGVVGGQVIATDGWTVLYGARIGWSMAESAGPEEAAEGSLESAGESTTGESAGEMAPGLVETTEEPPQPTGELPVKEAEEEPPAPGAPAVVALRLDAALPERVVVGRAFDLAVAVRRPESPPIAPDDLARRESGGFGAVWPADAVFIQLRIQISAPDCDIQGGDTRPVRLFAGQDGPMVYFQLTPRLAGPLSIIITVYQEMDWVGSARLRTEATTVEPRGGLAIAVSASPVGDPEVNQTTLWKALDDGYNDSELRDLCFELAIDYEDLAGDNQSARARELVLFAKRRDLLAKLVECVMRDRPHLLAPG